MAYFNSGYNQDNQGLSYPQLVFNQIRTIQELCKKELKSGDKIYKNLVGEQVVENEDTRFSYLQSIEVLASLLFPYFPKKIENSKVEDINFEFESFTELFNKELIEYLTVQENLQEVSNFFGKSLDTKEKITEDEKRLSQVYSFFMNKKLKSARSLFRSLLILFKNNDFLEGQSYGEGSEGLGDELAAVDDEIEDKEEQEPKEFD